MYPYRGRVSSLFSRYIHTYIYRFKVSAGYISQIYAFAQSGFIDTLERMEDSSDDKSSHSLRALVMDIIVPRTISLSKPRAGISFCFLCTPSYERKKRRKKTTNRRTHGNYTAQRVIKQYSSRIIGLPQRVHRVDPEIT